MSEPLAERLSRFTPAADLDRDALLFAAGRASVRPNRRWIALACALASCQLLTLVSLWPRTPASPQPVAPFAVSVPVAPPTPHDPSELGALSERLLASEGDWIAPTDDGPMIATEPPLRASDPPPAKYLN